MFTLKHVFVANCRFLSTRGSAVPKSLHKTESPETVVEKNQKLPNNQMGFTEDGGLKFHGFTYYPRLLLSSHVQMKLLRNFFAICRFPGQQDPPYEPSKVLMVERIRTLKHRPYWEKDVLAKLGLPMEVKVRTWNSIGCRIQQFVHLNRARKLLLLPTHPPCVPNSGRLSIW